MNEKLDEKKIESALERAARKALHGTRLERSGWLAMSAPKAFVSYSRDSPAHKEWVLKLASDLRAMGIDITLDQWDLVPGQDVSLFMQRAISEADRVIMVCSATYVTKAEGGLGGVGFERLVVTGEVVQSIDTTKFIPILRGSDPKNKLPRFLGPRLYIDFENDENYEENLISLARQIHGAPAIPKPPLGANPFSGKLIKRAVAVDTNAALPSNVGPLQSTWFEREHSYASSGLQKVGITGSTELRATISFPLSKSQIELLNAVRQSEIRTFGWPIGITLENRDEYRPRPYEDGIRAIVAIQDDALTGRNSFDYWALLSNGAFYLLQSLFEDARIPSRIFFDTRIVRVTESLMFLENLYSKLGASSNSEISLQVTHRGLKDRTLASASSRRYVHERQTRENESTSNIVTILGGMKENRVRDVMRILEPLFMLFDFAQFGNSVYEDIVRSFENGVVR